MTHLFRSRIVWYALALLAFGAAVLLLQHYAATVLAHAGPFLIAPVVAPQLRAQRLTGLIRGLRDERGIPGDLTLLNRTSVVPAEDDEMLGEWQGSVRIADIVADDGKAVVRQTGRIVPTAHAIPNIKHGANLTQRNINDLYAASQRVGTEIRDDEVGLDNWVASTLDDLDMGVQQRMEMLLWACATDGLSMGSYDRIGIKMDAVTWRMPASLKVVAGVPITTTGSATPVETVWNVKLQGTVYSAVYDRISMSTPLFRAMIATDEFKAKAALFLPQTITYANMIAQDLGTQARIASDVLGMEIELIDARYIYQNNDGTEASLPYLPLGLAVLSVKANDNNRRGIVFGNGITTESIVTSMVDGAMIGGLGGPQRGPIAYATVPPDLNSPSITMWAVARGFPIKRNRAATAVINFGTVTDPIPFVQYP